MKNLIREASEHRQLRIGRSEFRQPLDWQNQSGEFEVTETMRAGMKLARRKVITWLDLYHWHWKQERQRLVVELAALDARFGAHLRKAKKAKQRRRLEIRRSNLARPILSALAGHLSNPTVGITGDQADAGHRFMVEYQRATSALAGRSVWIGDRVGGGGSPAAAMAGFEIGVAVTIHAGDALRHVQRAHGPAVALIVRSVCGHNESITAAARAAGLRDRRGKGMVALRAGLETLRARYAHEPTSTQRFRQTRVLSAGASPVRTRPR